jgi:hypothetical protein
MKLLAKVKFVGAMTLLAGGVGYLVSRFGGQMKQKLKESQKKRELQAELAAVLGEKARIEEELRQLEAPDEGVGEAENEDEDVTPS